MMNLNMKSLFGQANKGLGKLKGFIFGSSSSEETSQAPQSETNQKINPNQPQKIESDSYGDKRGYKHRMSIKAIIDGRIYAIGDHEGETYLFDKK